MRETKKDTYTCRAETEFGHKRPWLDHKQRGESIATAMAEPPPATRARLVGLHQGDELID